MSTFLLDDNVMLDDSFEDVDFELSVTETQREVLRAKYSIPSNIILHCPQSDQVLSKSSCGNGSTSHKFFQVWPPPPFYLFSWEGSL